MPRLSLAKMLDAAKPEILDGVFGHPGTLDALFNVLALTAIIGRPGGKRGPLLFNELPGILRASVEEWSYNLVVTRMRRLLRDSRGV